MIANIFFNFAASLRNKNLGIMYSYLKKCEYMKSDELESIQTDRLREYFSFLAMNNPFYKQLFRDLKITPEETNISELKKIPITTKSDLLQYYQRYDNSWYFKQTFKCETSGTSGQVLNFRRDEEWDSFNRATMMRGYSWHGVNYSDFNIYFWGYNFSFFEQIKARILDNLMNRYRIFSYSDLSVSLLLSKIYKAKYISGYSSMIYKLAEKVEGKVDKTKLQLRMIKGTSEKIYPHYSSQTITTFGLPIISEYGAAETGIIAFSCKNGNMHINVEGVVVEVDDNGEIIVTNLYSKSFAIVRYRLGDVVRLAPPYFKCNCGLPHPVILEVTGRIGKVIVGYEKSYPSLTLYYIFKNLYFTHKLRLNYQAHQEKIGELEIWLSEGLNENELTKINLECKKYFSEDLIISIKDNKALYHENGKLRDFISKIN